MDFIKKIKKSFRIKKNVNPKWSGGAVGFAHIEILPIENKSEIKYIPIKYIFPFGHGEKISEDSSLVKPFRKLMDDGEPIGKMNFLFYQDNKKYYVLGSLVNTEKRLIFFPGLIPDKVIESPPDQEKIKENSLNIDHLTLDKNWYDWHFSFKQQKQKGKHRVVTRKTKAINEETKLWFVMAVQKLEKLEVMPQTQEYRLKVPNSSELDRRVLEFMDAREGSEFPVMEVGGNPEGDWYLNLEFFVDKKMSKNHRDDYPRTSTVYNANHLSDNKIKIIKGLHSRLHHVKMIGFEGRVWVRVAKIPGLLKNDAYFIPGADVVS